MSEQPKVQQVEDMPQAAAELTPEEAEDAQGGALLLRRETIARVSLTGSIPDSRKAEKAFTGCKQPFDFPEL